MENCYDCHDNLIMKKRFRSLNGYLYWTCFDRWAPDSIWQWEAITAWISPAIPALDCDAITASWPTPSRCLHFFRRHHSVLRHHHGVLIVWHHHGVPSLVVDEDGMAERGWNGLIKNIKKVVFEFFFLVKYDDQPWLWYKTWMHDSQRPQEISARHLLITQWHP